MWKIIKLDPQLANQIAAGEVVERPVSVIKELVENSVDAGSTEIRIDIEEWGIQKIVITDNGWWISKEDLPLVPEKYATSKISSLQDLYNVMTFGFRWEALSSISSVSQFEIISKMPEESFWNSLKIHDGQVWQIETYPAETGTKIIIENLFYNTPARLNYLKKPRTEYNHILDFLNNMAMSYPHIWFQFNNDGKNIFHYQSGETLETRLYSIYGDQISSQLIPIDFSLYWMRIHGMISDPKVSFWNKNRQVLYVNKRVIKSPLIMKAISDAYNRFIPHGMHPVYILQIEVNPTEVDVNVHPRKMEVRFANESSLFKAVHSAIFSKLESTTLLSHSWENDPEWEKSEWSAINNNFSHQNNFQSSSQNSAPQYYTGSGTKFKSYSPYKNIESNPAQWKIGAALDFSKATLDSEHIQENSGPVHNSNDLHYTKMWKIIGQMHNSYIIVETESWMQILDQHALAERIIYEKLVKSQYTAKVQGLLIGESIQLQPKELAILEENRQTFEEMWFDIEIFQAGSLMINGIPDFIKKENLSQIFTGILEDIGSQSNNKSQTLEEVRNKIFAYTACRSAIKFWNKLNLFEMNRLLNDAVMDYSATCPHGRPVIYEMNLQELQDKYER